MSNQNELDETSPEIVDTEQDFLNQLCVAVLPLWANQIDAAKQLTNSSIEELSAKFSDLSQGVRVVIGSGQSQSNEKLIDLLNQSQRQLSTVIQLLKDSINDKKIMLQAISSLSGNTKELLSMADAVTRISKETGMVAVNAAIEAARVGERGRGFAVVADAVRRLSTDAEETGALITETVNRTSDAIKNVSNVSKEFEVRDAKTLVDAEDIVSNVIDKFGQTANDVMTASQNVMDQSQHVAEEIDQVLFFLQFQDRVSQMLTLVQQDINKLNLQLTGSDKGGSVTSWLDELKSTYTMRELNQIHDQVSGPTCTSKSKRDHPSKKMVSNDSDDITFF